MRVISRKTLRRFWENPKRPKDVKSLLTAWYKAVLFANWRHFADLRQTFNSSDRVGDCIMFNVGGNKYRVIGRVRYSKAGIPGVVYVLSIMTHPEYDENAWPDECGCFEPPPAKKNRPPRRNP